MAFKSSVSTTENVKCNRRNDDGSKSITVVMRFVDCNDVVMLMLLWKKGEMKRQEPRYTRAVRSARKERDEM